MAGSRRGSIRFLTRSDPADPDALVLFESTSRLEETALRRAGLSSREVEVLALTGKGLRNSEVGRALCITPATVKKHLENCYRKLGVRSRMAAVARARELAGTRAEL